MRIRHLIACGLAALALTAAGCGDDGGDKTASYTVDAPPAEEASGGAETPAAAPAKGAPKVRVPSGSPPKQLQTKDLKQGTGATAKAGDQVSVDYVGVAYSTKKEFDSSFQAGREPIPVTLGAGQVIAGWDEGIVGMKVGGRRELIIPPDKAYGAAGRPPDIGPNETLVFVVDLVGVE
jgi:peptidylprolyl isomerase